MYNDRKIFFSKSYFLRDFKIIDVFYGIMIFSINKFDLVYYKFEII